MKISQSPQDLIIHHRQPGRWILAIACLGIGVALASKASFISALSCQRTTTLPNCTLTYHSLSGSTSESGIQVKAIYSSPICLPPEISRIDCLEVMSVLETQRGEVYVLRMKDDFVIEIVNQFIKQPNSAELQLELYGWSLNHPLFNLGYFILPLVMLILQSECIRQKKAYRCQFNKSSGWVTVTRVQFYGQKVVTTEFPIAEIETVYIRWFISNCLILKLRSGKQVRVAELLWIPIQTKRSLEEGHQAITEFLQ